MEILFCRILWIKLFSPLLIIWMHKLKCHVQIFFVGFCKGFGTGVLFIIITFVFFSKKDQS